MPHEPDRAPFSTSRSSNPTGGLPASGSRTRWSGNPTRNPPSTPAAAPRRAPATALAASEKVCVPFSYSFSYLFDDDGFLNSAARTNLPTAGTIGAAERPIQNMKTTSKSTNRMWLGEMTCSRYSSPAIAKIGRSPNGIPKKGDQGQYNSEDQSCSKRQKFSQPHHNHHEGAVLV